MQNICCPCFVLVSSDMTLQLPSAEGRRFGEHLSPHRPLLGDLCGSSSEKPLSLPHPCSQLIHPAPSLTHSGSANVQTSPLSAVKSAGFPPVEKSKQHRKTFCLFAAKPGKILFPMAVTCACPTHVPHTLASQSSPNNLAGGGGESKSKCFHFGMEPSARLTGPDGVNVRSGAQSGAPKLGSPLSRAGLFGG